MQEQLGEFLQKYGTFKFDQKNNLNEEDFLRIYDLIESVGRFELNELRNKNENNRRDMFSKAFVGDNKESKESFKKYIDKVFSDIE